MPDWLARKPRDLIRTMRGKAYVFWHVAIDVVTLLSTLGLAALMVCTTATNRADLGQISLMSSPILPMQLFYS